MPRRRTKSAALSGVRRKSVLVVLFIPSVQRDGVTEIDQESWVTQALDFFGRVFGGATAYPRARGVWRDDARGGALIRDNPVVLHCYTSLETIEDAENLKLLKAFCTRMGQETKQGEIGLVIDNQYLAVAEF